MKKRWRLIHQVELDYEGSCAVDINFLKAAGMQEYEKVDIYNVTNGERFSTYLILAEENSKTISVNGAAAHKVSIDDVVIICTYGSYDENEAAKYMKEEKIDLLVNLNLGKKEFSAYTMDFTKKYIEINSDYRT